ncbi:hypothetical protein [Actinocrispum wychmicini]|uniref:Uncharacterized protein n=1 Tax=Actinocrispum wychmicini TaxID=1213861 RepID=A0A4R2JEW6_9PSEU|nr:hypothetical protein [Actinocrispum wychmicini]TCO58251.1 hypothetical protein EV192_105316 [Actinocrispum wychmicini]
MSFRDLTIRVLGEFSNAEYAGLAYEVGLRLRAAGLGERSILMVDGDMSSQDMHAFFGAPDPLPHRNWTARWIE